ncbi:MAG: hypothetical protein ACRD1Y_04725 [Terriglobales bacterium]
MPKRFHSSAILVVVFILGLAAGIAGMVWAWPGMHARYFQHPREPYLHHVQTTLRLTPQQVTQVQGVFKDAGQLRHRMHLEFAPQYEKLCEQYMQVRQQERDTYMKSPERRQLLTQLQGIMTTSQWQQWRQMQASGNHHVRRDPCHHPASSSSSAGSGSGSHR